MRTTPTLRQCLVKLRDAKFAPTYKGSTIYANPINFRIDSPASGANTSWWAVTGPQKTSFLKVLSGSYICSPPASREFPNNSYEHIKLLNFAEQLGLDQVHMAARYESFLSKGELEMTDDVNSVRNYVSGDNNYNSITKGQIDPDFLAHLMKLFNLEHLQNKWINALSNGQMRRARIAKALVARPKLLVVDDPFLGLDPRATVRVLELLAKVASELEIAVVLGLRTHDEIPQWIQQKTYIDDLGRNDTAAEVQHDEQFRVNRPETMIGMAVEELPRDSHIVFDNAQVIYRGLPVLKNFSLRIPRGLKWRVLGDNGTGKTTILLIITADHPQLWRLVISIDGVLRRLGLGVNVFDVNNRIGISSPELHAVVPRHQRTMKQIIRNGLVPDIGNSNFAYKGERYDYTEWAQSILARFNDRLEAVGDHKFADLSVSDQKLTLFLRAILKNPEILILDEAFSCMDNMDVMSRCHDIVAKDLPDTTVLSIGHLDWELAHYDFMVHLLGNDAREYKLYRAP